jgi:hypothetical protein
MLSPFSERRDYGDVKKIDTPARAHAMHGSEGRMINAPRFSMSSLLSVAAASAFCEKPASASPAT